MTDKDVERAYDKIKAAWEKDLKRLGVKMPGLRLAGQFTQNALILVALYDGWPNTRPWSKEDLTDFDAQFRGKRSNDLQPRHLAAQLGWWVASGERKDVLPDGSRLPGAYYKLVYLDRAFPGFKEGRREAVKNTDFDALKAAFGFRCASCGSKEGDRNLRQPSAITSLQAGHQDPAEPLGPGNWIPQCSQCNRPSRGWFVYDSNGRVVAVASSDPVFRASVEVQKKVLRDLLAKFPGERSA